MSYKACPVCQQPAQLDAQFCQRCGHQFRTEFTSRPPDPTQMFSAPPGHAPAPMPSQDNNWLLIAIILGIFLGMFGVHRMYLGHTSSGITMLVLTLIGIVTACLFVGYVLLLAVCIWAIVDVISIATGNLRPVRPI